MIIFDNIIESLQSNGGIKNYFQEQIDASILNDESIKVINYNRVGMDESKNTNTNYYQHQTPRAFERYRKCKIIEPTGSNHFMSSYYRTPSIDIDTTVTVHDFIYERFYRGIKKRIHSFQKNKAIQQANKIICISDATRKDLLHFHPETDIRKVHVIHNGVNDNFKCFDYRKKRNDTLIYVGSRAPYKNFTLAARILKILDKFQMIVVGDPFTRAEQGLISSLGIQKRINLETNINDARLIELYNEAMFCVYPSLYEGFGIPILEAARCGCIPIVGPTPALMETGHNTALITNSFDAQDWGSLLYRYSTNPTQRSETQERIITSSSDFSWAKSARDTIDVIKS